ncbi:MAG: sigma-54 dependent transcriptional regulator [Sulfurospirillaceae bacterium]|nr:sigma-54 dependent transcriptional regulator [Sulfurospirillaceae bacterium]MCK9545527.1 sigma-54 dependent transcriptional regulator [Sulfurospirillaceae bacterium]
MKIVVVEDDINMRKSLEFALGEYSEFEIIAYKNATEALKKMPQDCDLVITDINMPGMDGLTFIKELNGKFEVIVITGNATLNRAIESVRLGVKDFLTKPFEIDTLVEAIKRSETIAKKSRKKITTIKNSNFLATSPVLERALNLAKRAAKTDATVLLLGESGVGKELFANYVHQNSLREKGPFVALNMAAIPENLLESELFGFEKGAFTDASSSKKGHFELANGGTLFLDEIGEMPISLQAKLLRALQEKEVSPLGGSKPVKIDVRIVSATNANIQEKIKKGEFREDLYYRLNTIPVTIPPLKERTDEIEPIAVKTLERVCKEYDLDEKTFSKEALKELKEYGWPGNIRELISVVERAAILSENEAISKDDLFLESRQTKDEIGKMEKNLIVEVLNSVNNDKEEACKILGFSLEILELKLKKYHL